MDNQFKNSFVFVLGREQEIALEELKAVFSRFDFCFDIYKITANQVFANIDNFTINDAERVMDALAGTIKIYKLEGRIDKDIASQIASIFRAHKTDSEGKINFAISYFGRGFSRQNINSIALTAKKQLKGDFSLRYVESRDSFELSSILSLKNNLLKKGIEFGLFDDSIGIMIALNNPEEWSKRDYDKPAADKYSGMLPPKLARMMINLALGELRDEKLEMRESKDSEDHISQVKRPHFSKLPKPLVLDPFCGSGNVLMEGMLLGCDVIGSDISDKAVEDTKKNLDWLIGEYQIPSMQQVFQADAVEYNFSQLVNKKYDRTMIVAEPFLGEPKKFKPTYNAAVGEYLKIKELYLSFLRNVAKYSSSKARSSQPSASNNNMVLCIVFPLVETVEGRRFSLFKESVDEIRELGYTQIRQSMTYGRDYQVVKREIVLLQLK
jgi:tRNA G10  N-methylase Trm11